MNRKEKKLLRVAISVTIRFIVASPLVVLVTVLYISVIGLPLGIPLGLLVGRFIGKPINDLDFFHPDRVIAKEEAEIDEKNKTNPDWWVKRKGI